MTRTKVTITIDTEASIGGAFSDPDRYHPLFEGPVDGMVDGRSEGLGFLIRSFAEYDIQATFFIETLHTRYFSEELMSERCRQLAEAGQDLQLHAHPCWRSFRDGALERIDTNDESWGRPVSELIDIFQEAQNRFESLVGRPAIAARTGKFSTNTETFAAMRQAGIQLTSNICTAIYPPQDQDLRLANGRHWIDGILEIPVTCFSSWTPRGRRALRPLQVCACSIEEMRQALDQAHEVGLGHVMIVTHPFEFIKKKDFTYSDIKVNRLIQKRLVDLCHYLCRNNDRFEVVSMAQCADRMDQMTESAPQELSGGLLKSTKRMAENIVNDVVWAL